MASGHSQTMDSDYLTVARQSGSPRRTKPSHRPFPQDTTSAGDDRILRKQDSIQRPSANATAISLAVSALPGGGVLRRAR